MTNNFGERFERVVDLVRDGMEQRFRRDRVVVHVDDNKIKIELARESGSLGTRESSAAALDQASPNALANTLPDWHADRQKRIDLLAYAKAQFPSAADVRPLDDDFDREVVGIVQLKFQGARVSAGFSRELWDDIQKFEPLPAFMERHRWCEIVNSTPPTRRAIVWRNGWLDHDDKKYNPL